MPLHADGPGDGVLDGLDYSVACDGGTTQHGRDVGDGLVVSVAHHDLGASEDVGEPCPRLDRHGLVDEQVVTVRTVVHAVALDVGDERASEGDVEQLRAAAEAEQRDVGVDGRADGVDAELVGSEVDAVLVRHRPGDVLRIEALSRGAAALGLLDNALAARSRPEASMSAARAVTTRAVLFRGTRGEAEEAARELLTGVLAKR